MRFLKRALKVLGVLILITILIPIAGVLGWYGMYHHIVSATPSMKVPETPGELGAQVNVFAATGGFPWMCGHDTPAATTPFGMVRLGPDTASMFTNETGQNRSGYYYGDNKIIGFSHTRLVGADSQEGGRFRIFPAVGSDVAQARGKEHFAKFSHSEEAGFPGYYAVQLPEDDIRVELTATPRVGVHRYTFSNGDTPHLLIDVTSGIGHSRCENGVVKISPDVNEVEGSVRAFGTFSSRYGGLDTYFVARFSKPFAEFGAWGDAAFATGAKEASGKKAGVDLAFAKGEPIEVRLAVSYVSIANARLNLDAEAGKQSFDEIVNSAKKAWEERLTQIRIKGGTETQRRIFYTALYHAFEMPTVFNDVNGEYMGFDKAVHKAEGFRYFTDLSLWDTVRTVHPLYNLIARDDERDMMKSLVEMVKIGGSLPRWPSGAGYTHCMFGSPGDLAVSETYLKGVTDFDVKTAYQSMCDMALGKNPAKENADKRDGMEWYLQYGYCPSDKMDESVASTLEYANADYSISLLAAALGQYDDAKTLSEHAKNYKNLWNPDTQYFQPRDSSGAFMKDFRPLMLTYMDSGKKYTKDYVEGSALQWRWAVPADAEGLVSLFHSPEYFASELNTFFEKSNSHLGWWNPGPYYWHGNEPDIQAVYLFNAAGRPDLTQKWVRWILDTKYADDYVGLDGNDDAGALSAWYVFSAIGFYPVAGTDRYELGAPLFDEAEIRMGDKTLKIIASNSSAQNIYAPRILLNDKSLEKSSILHGDIALGGTVQFEMGSAPGKAKTQTTVAGAPV